MTGRNTRTTPALLTALIMLGACASNPKPGATTAAASPATSGIAALRVATKPYQNLDAAVAAGYQRTVSACIVDAQHGAMGFHHTNSAYMDRTLDPAKPEILLYQRMPDGSYKLNGAEFIVPYRFWPRDTVAPVFMGQTLHREDNLKYWYLHVWAWTDNPDGVFANMNPNVTCPEGTAKVYKAFPDPGEDR